MPAARPIAAFAIALAATVAACDERKPAPQPVSATDAVAEAADVALCSRRRRGRTARSPAHLVGNRPWRTTSARLPSGTRACLAAFGLGVAGAGARVDRVGKTAVGRSRHVAAARVGCRDGCRGRRSSSTGRSHGRGRHIGVPGPGRCCHRRRPPRWDTRLRLSCRQRWRACRSYRWKRSRHSD